MSESVLPLRLAIKRYKDIVAKGMSTASESQAIIFVAERKDCGMASAIKPPLTEHCDIDMAQTCGAVLRSNS